MLIKCYIPRTYYLVPGGYPDPVNIQGIIANEESNLCIRLHPVEFWVIFDVHKCFIAIYAQMGKIQLVWKQQLFISS